MEDNLTINWELKRAIREAGYTQESFSKDKKVRINRSIISSAINGRINLTPEERKRIADALGRQEEELF